MDIPSLSTFGSLAAIGGLGAAMAASWGRIKSFIGYVRSLFVLEVTLDLDEVRSDYLCRFLLHKFKAVYSSDKYIGIRQWTTPDPKNPYVEVEYPYLPALFYRGTTFLFLTHRNSFLYIRGTVDYKALLKEAREFCLNGQDLERKDTIPNMYEELGYVFPIEDVCGLDSKAFISSQGSSGSDSPSPTRGRNRTIQDDDATLSSSPKREYLYRRPDEFGGIFWTPEQLKQACESETKSLVPAVLDQYFFSEETLKVIEQVWNWYHSKNWYESRQIPWQRGILLYGPAGSGKSTTVEVIANLLNLVIYRFNLATFSDQEFIKKYQETLMKAECCIILFEDFDNIYDKRTPAKGVNLTFDCLLNQISGVGTGKKGRILAITTNDLSKVDPAIGQLTSSGVSSRPGRIDDILYIGEACDRSRKEMCHRVLRDWPDLEEKAFNETSGMVISQVRAHCINLALKRLSEKK